MTSPWRQYFEMNAQSRASLPWSLGAALSPTEITAIAASMAEFQLGEQSEGRHLTAQAQAYAGDDQEFPVTIRLFIAEEQRHARDLGRFMRLCNLPLRSHTGRDQLFRWLRRGNLETTLSILITAEIVATLYYPALGAATQSELLQALCTQIAAEEKQHVCFQAEQLHELRQTRSPFGMALTLAMQRLVFAFTLVVVWFGHRRVLSRGGLSWRQWWQQSWQVFETAFGTFVATPISSTS